MTPAKPPRVAVRIVENGPYLVSGGLPLGKEIIGTNAAGESVRWTPGETYPAQEKYALCRCGHSGNKPFCGIFSYARHVSLEFSQGASLPDEYQAFEGEGKLRRHIKLTTARDIAEKHVHAYLAAAIQAAAKT